MVLLTGGSQWKLATGSVEELIDYMNTGSVNPIDVKGFVHIQNTGSIAVVYHR